MELRREGAMKIKLIEPGQCIGGIWRNVGEEVTVHKQAGAYLIKEGLAERVEEEPMCVTMPQEGWICPRCGTVNAPFAIVCGNVKCRDGSQIVITTSGTTEEEPMILKPEDDIQAVLEKKGARMRYLLIPVDPDQVHVVGKSKMMDAAAHQARFLMGQLLDEKEDDDA
jgi:hypothetical protein